MSVGLQYPDQLLPITGVRLASSSAGLYNHDRPDLGLIEIKDGAAVSAVFTRNRFCAAPVRIAKQHLSLSAPRYCLVNAGNANAGNGQQGLDDAFSICGQLSSILNCKKEAILPFSTGVIGERLAVTKIEKALPALVKQLSEDNWLKMAQSIMTTDTMPKGVSSKVVLANNKIVTVTGIVKGSGMIKPNMATMLAFIATDAKINVDLLREILNIAVNKSFNRITVDGETSTNDACVLIATQQADNIPIVLAGTDDYAIFASALFDVFKQLAHAVIRDGEGAKKFVAIEVKNGLTQADCLSVAYQIAESPLVKTALTASDPNWGRILAAVGSANTHLSIDHVSMYINDVCMVQAGCRHEGYIEERGKQAMRGDNISILVDLACGNQSETIWTTDLSHEYIRINAEYRT